MGSLRSQVVVGQEIEPFVGDLARLRIEVFREYPYLYEGTEGYEEKYLRAYAESAESVFVLAFDGARVVGVSTGLPLVDADPAFSEAFRQAGEEVGAVFYFGESVLAKEYRGGGMGRIFMEEREKWARALGRFGSCAFCAVEREAEHPLRPDGYRALDDFWRGRGFERREELRVSFRWREVGAAAESGHEMVFWVKKLGLK